MSRKIGHESDRFLDNYFWERFSPVRRADGSQWWSDLESAGFHPIVKADVGITCARLGEESPMKRQLLIGIIALLIGLPLLVSAQDSPDYSIRNIRHKVTSDGRQIVVEFEVYNVGVAASEQATANLRVIATGQELATATIDPLRSQEITTVSLSFDVTAFPENDVVSLRAAVGVDEVEPAGSQNIQNNFAQTSVTIPPYIPEATPEPTPEPTPTNTGNPITDLTNQVSQQIDQRLSQLDLTDPVQAVTVALVSVACLVIGVIAILVLIALSRRPPDPRVWQPPYANLMPQDPNTLGGRRQQWQTHAVNNLLPPYGTAGQYQVRKLLTSADGHYLHEWKAAGLRMSQYDAYGRVARSQVLVSGGAIKRLNGAIKARHKLDTPKLQRRLIPVARELVKRMKGKWNPRNSVLPLVLDLRFEGRYGKSHIWFELVQYRGTQWEPVDRWEPEMPILGKIIHESFSMTAFGQRPGEDTRAFRTRLQDDLAALLAELLTERPVTTSAPRPESPPTNPHMEAVTVPQGND